MATSFEVLPKCPYMAVRWLGDNEGEVRAFLARLPPVLLAGTPWIRPGDRGMLEISGYRCAIKQSYINVIPGSWLICSFSEMDGGFALMQICPEEFEAAFTVTPGPAKPIGLNILEGYRRVCAGRIRLGDLVQYEDYLDMVRPASLDIDALVSDYAAVFRKVCND